MELACPPEELIKAVGSSDDREPLPAKTSICDDHDSPRDRERPRQSIAQSRQTLGAVGRVASRVRTSGISMISTSFLPWAKEEDGDIEDSPWGVGKAAMPRSQSTSVLPDSPLHDIIDFKTSRPISKPGSDVVDASSPVSFDTPPTPTDDAPQSQTESGRHTPKSDPSPTPKADRTRNGDTTEHRQKAADPARRLERLASAATKSKFTFRPSFLVESQSQPAIQKGQNPLARTASEAPITSVSKGVEIAIESEVADFLTSKQQSPRKEDPTDPLTCGTNDTPKQQDQPQELSREKPEPVIPKKSHEVERSKLLSLVGFGRSKPRSDDSKRKSNSHSEKHRGKVGIPLSRSKAPKPPLPMLEQIVEVDALRPSKSVRVPGPTRGRFGDQKLQKQPSGTTKTKKSRWFGFLVGDHGSERTSKQQAGSKKDRLKAGSRSGANEQTARHDLAGKTGKGEDGSNTNETEPIPKRRGDDREENSCIPRSIGASGVPSSDDFVMASDDGDTDASTAVRSLAVDDFIMYQTKKGKKGVEKQRAIRK